MSRLQQQDRRRPRRWNGTGIRRMRRLTRSASREGNNGVSRTFRRCASSRLRRMRRSSDDGADPRARETRARSRRRFATAPSGCELEAGVAGRTSESAGTCCCWRRRRQVRRFGLSSALRVRPQLVPTLSSLPLLWCSVGSRMISSARALDHPLLVH